MKESVILRQYSSFTVLQQRIKAQLSAVHGRLVLVINVANTVHNMCCVCEM